MNPRPNPIPVNHGDEAASRGGPTIVGKRFGQQALLWIAIIAIVSFDAARVECEEMHGSLVFKSDKFSVTVEKSDGVFDFQLPKEPVFRILPDSWAGADPIKITFDDNHTETFGEVSLIQALGGNYSSTPKLLRMVLYDKTAFTLVPAQVTEKVEAVQLYDEHNHPLTNATRTETYGVYQVNSTVKTMEFVPPLVVRLRIDDDEGKITISDRKVKKIEFPEPDTESQNLRLQLQTVSSRVNRVVFRKSEGITGEDGFYLASGAMPFRKPGQNEGKEISWIANADKAEIPLLLEHSHLDPTSDQTSHVLSFFGEREGFDCNDFVVDGVHKFSVTPIPTIQVLRIPTVWWKFWKKEYQPVDLRIDVGFDEQNVYVYDLRLQQASPEIHLRDIRLASLDAPTVKRLQDQGIINHLAGRSQQLSFPLHTFSNQIGPLDVLTVADLAEESRAALRPSLKLVGFVNVPIYWSATPLRVEGRIAPLAEASLGSYEGHIILRAANMDTYSVPVRFELYDPFANVKHTFVGVTGALVTSFLVWLIVDRRKKAMELAQQEERQGEDFKKQHYLEMRELQDRLGAADSPDNFAATIEWVLGKGLQSGLTTTQWKRFLRARATGDATATRQVLLELSTMNPQSPDEESIWPWAS